MRLSTRLLLNAATNYTRMAVNFVFGVFFVWYAIRSVGMVGLGMIGLTGATFGISAAVEQAMRGSLIREMAAAISSGEPARVSRSLTSAAALCVPVAFVLTMLTAILALLADFGVFRTPETIPGLDRALAILLITEGVHTTIRILCSPYAQALFAAQRVGLDNTFVALSRMTNAFAAVVVFGFLMPESDLATRLIGFGILRAGCMVLVVIANVVFARIHVSGLRLQLSAFDRSEFRSILGTVWHTGQVTLLMNLHVQVMAVLINFFFGLTYNGVWQVVVQIGGYARMFAEGLLHGVDPLSTHLKERGQSEVIVNLMLRTIRYQLGALLPVITVLLIFMHPILELWVSGSLALDAELAAAGIEVTTAIDMIAVMAGIHLVSQVVRGSTFGVERMLYGIGEVRAYSWFAKYAMVGNIALVSLLMWWFGTPVVAPISILLVYLAFYPGVVLRAGIRRAGLPTGRPLAVAVVLPVAASALLAVAVGLLRTRVDELNLLTLAGLAAGGVTLYAVFAYLIVLEPDERARIREVLRGKRHEHGEDSRS